ncbi:MAG: L,D-transpeptidase [Oscillospiraceae bacterium]|nr:L,D-transpeptidase [Oscillospiraceae bacterium]
MTLTPFEIRGITINPDPVTGAITQAEYDSIYDYRSPLPYSDYVLVDIPSQTLRYYVNGFEALFTYVVTGDYYQHPTPTGTFWLNGGKTQNATLIGEDYETFVNYWMPFIGGAYGMHDATWRSYFGGTIYKGNGSHGCVNMPFEKAKELYFMIPVGTMIIIR